MPKTKNAAFGALSGLVVVTDVYKRQDVRLLQRKGVKRGMISIQFSDDIARYLLCSYVMQYPEALQSIDERSPRAYRVGYKLAYHSSVRRNIERGTADIISVSALLDACGDIPDFDEEFIFFPIF